MKIEMSATRMGRFYATKELARLRLECRPCGNREVFALREREVWIGILLPLLRVGADHHLQCVRCWTTYDITKQDAAWLQDPESDLAEYYPRTTRRAAPGGRY